MAGRGGWDKGRYSSEGNTGTRRVLKAVEGFKKEHISQNLDSLTLGEKSEP